MKILRVLPEALMVVGILVMWYTSSKALAAQQVLIDRLVGDTVVLESRVRVIEYRIDPPPPSAHAAMRVDAALSRYESVTK